MEKIQPKAEQENVEQHNVNSQAQKSKAVQRNAYQSPAGQKPVIQTKQGQQPAYQSPAGQKPAIQAKTNNTGLSDHLKSGIENLSGHSMDDVKVHYNSDKPVQLQAHAYAQGTDIHVAPGQERHVPHEAWHVVQQKQGRVQPTTQLKSKGVNINDDAGLEREADIMGARALQAQSQEAAVQRKETQSGKGQHNSYQFKQVPEQNAEVVQRAVITVNEDKLIASSAQTVADLTGATAGAFAEVGDTETIYLFAHGYHSMTKPVSKGETTNLQPILMGGITAANLCQMMIEEGWSEEHTGAIDIRACMSGAESMLPSFAELFATELKRLGRSNIVTGYKHLTKTEGDGSETAMKSTVSKMIVTAQQFAKDYDPDDFSHELFVIEATGLFEARCDTLLSHRQKCNKWEKGIEALFVGKAPEEANMSDMEWNVYSFYHALQTNNKALIKALNNDFSAKDYQINQTVGGKHGRTFDPNDMVLEQVEEVQSGSDEDDLMARLAKLQDL